VALALGAAGLLAYNWWALVLLKPGLVRSPNELFSDLEVTGQPFATAMQHADFLSGLLLLGAFLVVGSAGVRGGRRDWLAMIVFACGGALGGAFPEGCNEELNAACRRMVWSFGLPLHDYLHIVAGIVEFAGITAAAWFAFRRTRAERTNIAKAYRALVWAAVFGYPVLGVAYLSDRLGAVIEAAFFVGFTVMVLAELLERARSETGYVMAEEAFPSGRR
jgi:hypothetical protein